MLRNPEARLMVCNWITTMHFPLSLGQHVAEVNICFDHCNDCESFVKTYHRVNYSWVPPTTVKRLEKTTHNLSCNLYDRTGINICEGANFGEQTLTSFCAEVSRFNSRGFDVVISVICWLVWMMFSKVLFSPFMLFPFDLHPPLIPLSYLIFPPLHPFLFFPFHRFLPAFPFHPSHPPILSLPLPPSQKTSPFLLVFAITTYSDRRRNTPITPSVLSTYSDDFFNSRSFVRDKRQEKIGKWMLERKWESEFNKENGKVHQTKKMGKQP